MVLTLTRKLASRGLRIEADNVDAVLNRLYVQFFFALKLMLLDIAGHRVYLSR